MKIYPLAKIFRLLIRQGKVPGSSLDELVHSLGFSGREMELGRLILYDHLNVLQKNVLKMIGLKIKYIPRLKTFTIVFDKTVEEDYLADLGKESFETLKYVLKLFSEFRAYIEVADLAKIRGLSISTIRKHLRELESKGYVIVRGGKVYKSPKLLILLEFIERREI